MSGLGEPLNAEIEIAASKDELSSLSARIAPPDVYAEQGLERTSALGGVRVELSRRADGTPVLKLSSRQSIDDPFLDMLVQVDWPTGRLLREYTALLDPPGYGDRANVAAEAKAETKQLPQAASPSKKNTSKNASGLNQPPVAAPASPAPSTYTTRRGDTLRKVARQMQVDDVTLEQMLVGLYQANRQAFDGDNMNQLKVGQIIRAPRKDDLHAINQQDALREVRAHTSNWNAYRNDVAQAVSQSGKPSAESPAQVSGGKISARTDDNAAPPAEGPRDVVKLSRSDAGTDKPGVAGSGKSAADDKIRALEEEATSQEKAISEVNERIAFFEKQIQDMQKLLLVQNQILADLQKAKPGETSPAPAAAPTPAPASPAQPAPAQPQAAKPEVKPAPKPAPEPAPEPGLLDDVLSDPVPLAAGGGVLALLLGGWFLVRRQRRKNLDSFEKGILTSSGLKTDTVFGSTGGAAVDTGETSFLNDFSHRNAAGMIDTSDVDPISEAEVYMAYGRDAQAEEILKDAIAKEPKRYELHLKLLEIYANRKDAASFETLAGELYASLSNNDPVWHKVAEMGRHLEPDNPMYQVSGEPVAATPAARPVAEVLAAGTAAAVAAEVGLAAAENEPAESDVASADNSLDFDLDQLAADQEEVAETAETLPELGEAADVEPELAAAEETLPELEFTFPETQEAEEVDFGLPEPAAEDNVQLDAADLGMSVEETPAETLEAISIEAPSVEEATTEAEPLSFDIPEEIAAAPEEVAAPDLSFEPETTQEPSVEEITLDVPEFSLPELETAAAEPEQAEALDLDAFELPDVPELVTEPEPEPEPEVAVAGGGSVEPVAEPIAPEAEPESTNDFEFPADFNLELPADTSLEQAEPAAAEESNPLDFNFDLEGASDIEETAEAPAAAAIPDLDLSGISLEVGEAAGEPAVEEITLSGAESPDVDTKLDLVTAYMDMGDTEGARELLEEVLQEGGPQQRAKAQKLLDSLA